MVLKNGIIKLNSQFKSNVITCYFIVHYKKMISINKYWLKGDKKI